MSTRPANPAIYLLAALMIVASLALSMPATSCWCAHDEHAGMLLHPLFPHHHANEHAAFVDDTTDELPASSLLERASASISPAVNGAPGDPGTGGFGGGEIVLPSLLLASALLSWRWWLAHTVTHDQDRASPLTPPPRRFGAFSPSSLT